MNGERATARPRVLLLPGAVMPAALAYAPLVEALGDSAAAVPKELELYSRKEPGVGRQLGPQPG
jgi:hypothetical protein